MVKISVIIPIYNVEDYLEETLNSLLNQTVIDDIEVLMIDDGSTDNSRYIIEKYALDYDNFHAFHKKNEGQGIARNFGLNKSKGDYIHFMDADDYIPPYAYEVLLKLNSKSDFIIFNVLRFANYNLWENTLFKHSFQELTENKEFKSLLDCPSLIWDTSASNKLYKKNFLIKNQIKFLNKNIYYEDLLFSLNCYLNSSNFTYFNDYLYFWRLRNDKSSVTQTSYCYKNIKDRIEILNLSIDLIQKHDFHEKILEFEYMKWLKHDFLLILKNINKYSEEEYCYVLRNIQSIIKNIPDSFFKDLISFKKILFMMIKNNDFKSAFNFSSLEKQFNENPYTIEIPDDYKKYFSTKNDFNKFNVKTKLLDVTSTDKEIDIKFFTLKNYSLMYDSILIKVKLIINNLEYNLDVVDNIIKIPIELIEYKNKIRIKIIFEKDGLINESYLENSKRKSLSFNNYIIDFGIGHNKQLYIDYIEKSDNIIEINEINFENNQFYFHGISKNKIDNIFLKNIVTFEIIQLPLKIVDNKLMFKIPYDILLNHPIKKWELNSYDSMNSIKVFRKFEFFNERNKISIFNSRNKVIIENNLINAIGELFSINEKNRDINRINKNLKRNYKQLKKDNTNLNNKYMNLKKNLDELNRQNKKLKKSNKKLKKDKENLNHIIEEYKSRKVIKITDKIKSIILLKK